MAKTKQDYIDLGRADFEANMPRKSFGTKAATCSWQENAYDAGYNGALRDAASQTQAEAIDLSTAPLNEWSDKVHESAITDTTQRAEPVTGCTSPEEAYRTSIARAASVANSADPLRDTAHALGSHICFLLNEAARVKGTPREQRLRDKAHALQKRWGEPFGKDWQ